MSTQPTMTDTLVDHLPRIRRVIRAVGKEEGIVDDLTQECCVRIIEKERLWKARPGKVEQWINALTRNLTIDHLKRRRRTHTVPLEDTTPAPDPEDGFSEEHIRWVLSQFGTLPDKQKQILQMKYFDGRKSVEIADELGVTPQTVSEHLHKALKTLKRRAREQGLLAALLPWNWNLEEHLGEIIMIMKQQKIATVFGILLGLASGVVGSKMLSTELEAATTGPDRDNLTLARAEASDLKDMNKRLETQIAGMKKQQRQFFENSQLERAANAKFARNVVDEIENRTPEGSSNEPGAPGFFTSMLKKGKVAEALKGVMVLVNKEAYGEPLTQEDHANLAFWNGYKTFLTEEMGLETGLKGQMQMLTDQKVANELFRSLYVGIIKDLTPEQEQEISNLMAEGRFNKDMGLSETVIGLMDFWFESNAKVEKMLTPEQLAAFHKTPASNFFLNNSGFPKALVDADKPEDSVKKYLTGRFDKHMNDTVSAGIDNAVQRLVEKVKNIDLYEFNGRTESTLSLKEKTQRRAMIYKAQVEIEKELAKDNDIKLDGMARFLIFESNLIEHHYRKKK